MFKNTLHGVKCFDCVFLINLMSPLGFSISYPGLLNLKYGFKNSSLIFMCVKGSSTVFEVRLFIWCFATTTVFTVYNIMHILLEHLKHTYITFVRVI